MSEENNTPHVKKPVGMTELLLRTPVGKAFYIDSETTDEAKAIQRAIHSRAAMIKSHHLKIKVKAMKAIVDADPNLPGDTDKVVRLIAVTIVERTAAE